MNTEQLSQYIFFLLSIVWDKRQQESVFSLHLMEDQVNSMISDNEKRMLVATCGGCIHAINLRQRKLKTQVRKTVRRRSHALRFINTNFVSVRGVHPWPDMYGVHPEWLETSGGLFQRNILRFQLGRLRLPRGRVSRKTSYKSNARGNREHCRYRLWRWCYQVTTHFELPCTSSQKSMDRSNSF